MRIGIVGATGAVGKEIFKCLQISSMSESEIILFATSRSAGIKMYFGEKEIVVEEFSLSRAKTCAVLFLAVPNDLSVKIVKDLSRGENHGKNPTVIDNSSAFRYLPNIPVVVPEINAAKVPSSALIANPNCTTAIAAMVLWPLHNTFKLKKVIISTYQAASGAGNEGMDELVSGTRSRLENQSVKCITFPHPLAFNIIPQIDKFQENGYTREEMKVTWELAKIFGIEQEEDIRISCTAVRVPTMRAHAESITIETERPITAHAARELLRASPGILVVDDPERCLYPMPLTATEQLNVEVGRIRNSLVFGDHGIDLFVCGDQLLRGAAWNAVLIAEELVRQHILS